MTGAIKLYSNALDSLVGADDLIPKLLHNRALALEQLNEYENALADSTVAIVLAPMYTKAWYRRAAGCVGIRIRLRIPFWKYEFLGIESNRTPVTFFRELIH